MKITGLVNGAWIEISPVTDNLTLTKEYLNDKNEHLPFKPMRQNIYHQQYVLSSHSNNLCELLSRYFNTNTNHVYSSTCNETALFYSVLQCKLELSFSTLSLLC